MNVSQECAHLNFAANVAVGRLSREDNGPITHYCAEVTVRCAECGQPFEFVGLPVGMSAYRPTVSLDGLEMRVPITPPGVQPPKGMPGYSISVGEFPQ